jgi:hypothetical protein
MAHHLYGEEDEFKGGKGGREEDKKHILNTNL